MRAERHVFCDGGQAIGDGSVDQTLGQSRRTLRAVDAGLVRDDLGSADREGARTPSGVDDDERLRPRGREQRLRPLDACVGSGTPRNL